MQGTKNYKNIEELKFFKVVDKIEKLKFMREKSYVTPTPPIDRIALAIFSILTFAYFFSSFLKNSVIKRKFLNFIK